MLILFLAMLTIAGQAQPLDTANFNELRKSAFGMYGKDANEMLRVGLSMKRIAITNNYREGLAASHNIIGLSRLSVSDYQKALENFLNALKIYEKLENQENIANVLSNVGVVYYYLDDHVNSLDYHMQAYEIRKELDNESSLSKSLNNIGISHTNLGQYNEALNFYQKARALKASLNDSSSLSNTINNIGRVYLLKNDYELALKYFLQSMQMDQALNNRLGVATSKLNIGEAELKKGNLTKAKSNLIAAIELAENIESLQVQMLAYQKLSDLYKSSNDYASAFSANEKYTSLSERINDIEIKREIANLEARYENDKILFENSLLSIENEKNELAISKQRNLITTLIVIGALLLILLVNTFRLIKFKSKSIRVEREKRKEISEKNGLISTQNDQLIQLSRAKDKIISVLAHDVKSPLNDVRSMIQLASMGGLTDRELREYLNQILKKSENVSNMIFNVLDWARTQAQGVSLHMEEQKLTEIVKNQFEFFESSAAEKNISLENNIDHRTIVTADKNVLNIIIRNLISNAIKFTQFGGKIEIRSKKENDQTWVCIKDSGVGMNDEEINKIIASENFTKTGTNEEAGHGLGLMLVKEFVIKQGGLLKITSQPNKGSEFIFSIPLRKVA